MICEHASHLDWTGFPQCGFCNVCWQDPTLHDRKLSEAQATFLLGVYGNSLAYCAGIPFERAKGRSSEYKLYAASALRPLYLELQKPEYNPKCDTQRHPHSKMVHPQFETEWGYARLIREVGTCEEGKPSPDCEYCRMHGLA